MLLYDNRGRLRLICQIYGSIYRRVAFPVICMVIYSSGLLAVRRFFSEYLPDIEHPFASQSFGTLIAFAVCFRTNIAWTRFWEACQEVTMMFSKWGDAFSQLQGFINSTIKISKDCDVQKLEHYRCEITHMFTLLSAMAVERLTRGDIRRMEMRRRKGVPWAEQVVFRENLRLKDLTGSRNLIPMKVVKVKRQKSSRGRRSNATEEEISEVSSSEDSEYDRRPKRLAVVPSMSKMSLHLKQIKDSWQRPVSIIGDLSKDELRRLRGSKDRINLVLLWLNELVTNLQPLILVPPPILSRVYQELSNGTLGYSQAEKLSDIPFPFIFAQLLAVSVLFFAVVSPITFTVMTGDSWITPLISSGVVIAFWSLNEIAKELENPFGEDANNLPLADAHERFVEFLVEMHGTTIPEDRDYMSARNEIRENCSLYCGSSRPSKADGESFRPSSRSVCSEKPGAATSTRSTRVMNGSGSQASGIPAPDLSMVVDRAQDAGGSRMDRGQDARGSALTKRVFPSLQSESSSRSQSSSGNYHIVVPNSGGPSQQDPSSSHRSGNCKMRSSLEHSHLSEEVQTVISKSAQQAQQAQQPQQPPSTISEHESSKMSRPEQEMLPTIYSDSHWEEGTQIRYAKAENVDLRIDEGREHQDELLEQQTCAQVASSSAMSGQRLPMAEESSLSDQNSDLGVPPSDQRLLS